MRKSVVFSSLSGIVCYLTFIIGCLYGYVHNIYNIFSGADTATITAKFVIQVIGVFVPPVGVIAGYFW